MKKSEYFEKMARATTPQEVAKISREYAEGEKAYSLAPRYQYDQGPMYYIGQKICVQMERLGRPSRIHCCYRSPEDQARLPSPNTNALPWQSPHQFYEACDIIEKKRGWPPVDDPYWSVLNDVAQNVAADLGVTLVGGYENWGWDFAHFELHDWRAWREVLKSRNGGKPRAPTEIERRERFKAVLPQVRYKNPYPRRAIYDPVEFDDQSVQSYDDEEKTLLQRLRDFF